MPDTLQSKTAAVRREHILAAATQLFAERGFHRVTIRDVAIAAGVSDGTIYNAFENKNALLLGMLEPLGRDMPLAGAPPAAPGDIGSFVGEMVARRWTEFTPAMLAALRVVLSESLVDADLRALFVARMIMPALTLPEAAFAALAADGQLGPADVPTTLRLITAAFLGSLLLRLLGDQHLEDHADAWPGSLATLLLDGLRPRAAADAHGAA